MTRTLENIQTPLLHLLVWSAVTEFLFLRIFLRLGPVLPIQEPLLPLYRSIETLGLAAINVAFLAACVLLITAALRLAMRPRARPAAAMLLLATAANAGLGPLVGLVPGTAATIFQSSVSLAAIITLFTTSQATSGRLLIGFVAAADGLAWLQVASQGATSLGLPLPTTTLPILAAEAMALAAAIALPWSFRMRPGWRLAALGAACSLALLLGLLARPWIISTVAMWTVTFSLGLPGALYALGLGTAIAALPLLWQEGGHRGIAARGLLLCALAGLKLDYSYFALLALGGVTLLCLPQAMSQPEQRPATLAHNPETHAVRTATANA